MSQNGKILDAFSAEIDVKRVLGLIATLEDICAHAPKDWIYEVEVRTHFVVPLFAELGWTYKYMKMEWRQVDILLLNEQFKLGKNNDDTNALNTPLVNSVVELKAPHLGLKAAHIQCQNYREKSFPQAARCITTNGRQWIIEEGRQLPKVISDVFNLSQDEAKLLLTLKRSNQNAMKIVS